LANNKKIFEKKIEKHETLNINCFFIEDIFVFNIKNEPYVVFKKNEKPIKMSKS